MCASAQQATAITALYVWNYISIERIKRELDWRVPRVAGGPPRALPHSIEGDTVISECLLDERQTMTPLRPVPLPLRLAYSAFMAVLIPVYWYFYGPTNFLYFCDLALILTSEQGKPLAEARGEIEYAAAFVEFFAEEAKRIHGETIPSHRPDARIVVLRQPIGVIASTRTIHGRWRRRSAPRSTSASEPNQRSRPATCSRRATASSSGTAGSVGVTIGPSGSATLPGRPSSPRPAAASSPPPGAMEAMVGADGIHSVVRRAFYPDEGAPKWRGGLLYRATTRSRTRSGSSRPSMVARSRPVRLRVR